MQRADDDYVEEVLRLEKPLRAFLHRFAPQPADLEDLLQETYSHLFRLPPERRRAIQNIQAFVMTSARNVAIDWLRNRQIVSIESFDEVSSTLPEDEAACLDDITHAHQQLARLAEGIGQLPERCRQVFTLRRIYGLSQKEIARKFDISEGAVEQLLIRGMRRCAELMSGGTADAAAPDRTRPRGSRRLKTGAEE